MNFSFLKTEIGYGNYLIYYCKSNINCIISIDLQETKPSISRKNYKAFQDTIKRRKESKNEDAVICKAGVLMLLK